MSDSSSGCKYSGQLGSNNYLSIPSTNWNPRETSEKVPTESKLFKN